MTNDKIDTDPWVRNHSPIDTDRLHALGYLSYRWNIAEVGLQVLYSQATGKLFDDAWATAHDKQFSELSKDIKKAISASMHDQEAKDAVVRCVEIYNIVRLNRNQLTHYMITGEPGNPEILNRQSAKLDQLYNQPKVPFDIMAIRKVCEEMDTMIIYFHSVLNHFISGQINLLFQTELPSMPPIPKRIWTPPQPSKQARSTK